VSAATEAIDAAINTAIAEACQAYHNVSTPDAIGLVSGVVIRMVLVRLRDRFGVEAVNLALPHVLMNQENVR
jgi:hypothetical protein